MEKYNGLFSRQQVQEKLAHIVSTFANANALAQVACELMQDAQRELTEIYQVLEITVDEPGN